MKLNKKSSLSLKVGTNMKRILGIISLYGLLMIILYFLKEVIVPECDTYSTTINLVIFVLHMIFIFSTILLTGNKIENVSTRYIVHSAIAVFYLTMLYIFLKFQIYQVICNI